MCGFIEGQPAKTNAGAVRHHVFTSPCVSLPSHRAKHYALRHTCVTREVAVVHAVVTYKSVSHGSLCTPHTRQ